MRKIVVLTFLLSSPLSLFAQSSIDRNPERWREGDRGDYHRNMFEITPFGGYRYGGTIFADRTDLFGEDVDVASSADYGLNLGIPAGDHMKVELMVNKQNTHLEAGGGLFDSNENIADMDITYYHAGLQVPIGESNGVTPFFVISAGVANLKPDLRGVSADNRFSASAGIGAKVAFSRNVGLRFEARGYFTSLGSNNNDRCRSCDNNHDLYQGETSAGLVISF